MHLQMRVHINPQIAISCPLPATIPTLKHAQHTVYRPSRSAISSAWPIVRA